MNAIKLSASLATFFAITVVAFTASGDSLGEKQRQKKAQELVDKRLEGTNKACGTKITAAIRFDTFKPHYSADGSIAEHGAGARCVIAANEVRVICGKDFGKQAVQKKVQRIDCRYAETEYTKITNGTVEVGYHYESSQLGDKINKALLEQL